MAHRLFERCELGTQCAESFVLGIDLFFLCFDLRLLLLDLILLFFEGVDKDGAQAIVFDAFDLAFLVAGDEQWLGRGDLLSDQAEVVRLAVLPIKRHRAQAVEETQTATPIRDVGLVANRRRAGRNLP